MRKVFALAAALLVLPAIAVATASAEPRDSVSRLFPVYDNGGKPDFTVDPQRFTAQMEIVDRRFDQRAARSPRERSAARATGGSFASTPS